MRRQEVTKTNPDFDSESDQNISDDDDLSHHLPRNSLSSPTSADKRQGFEILSRLELLQGTRKSGTKTSNLSHGEPTSSNFEDDVEMPNFYEEDDFICPSKKVISEDENNVLSKLSATDGAEEFSKDAKLCFGTEKHDGFYSWSAASKEAEALMHLSEHASCYSKPKKCSKVVKGKGKPKFSFGFQSHNEGLPLPSTSKDENNLLLSIREVPERLDPTEHRTEETLVAKLPEDIPVEEENLSEMLPLEVEPLRRGCSEQSMAELLDGLQDSTNLLRGNSRRPNSKRGKRLQLFAKRNISPLGERTVNREDSPDLMRSSGSSSDSETSNKVLELAVPRTTRQTIVDQFQEAFGDTFLNDNMALPTVPKPPRSGLFWKLQQVMQSEKERETDFLKKLESGASQNEASCIYGRILGRFLEGKLTVCHCIFSENCQSLSWSEEPLKEMANEGTKRTMIFNPRVCNDVDLEVGNCIRIHPPWKEVQVGNDKSIILVTYVSNFPSTSSCFPVEA